MSRTLRQALLAAIPIAFLVVPLVAQHSGRVPETEIQIHVKFDDNSPINSRIQVNLTNQSGVPVAQGYTDTDGRISFYVAGQGTYLVRASGPEVAEDNSEMVQVDPMDRMRAVFLRVKHPSGAVSAATSSGGQLTSAAELRIPQNARKSFDKGVAAWQKQDYQKAVDEFEKAVAAYPEYDMAYNNLGVMYLELNQPEKATTAFEHAVQLNDKNADADRNLARLMLRQKQYSQVEDLLKKALVVRAPDAATLTMLCVAEMQDGHVDDALKDAQKVHALPHEGYAVAHFVAGAALEEKHQNPEARAEYEMYLKENPNGSDVEQVKSALARLSSSAASVTPNTQ